MSEIMEDVDLTTLLAEARRVLDALQSIDLTPCTDEQVTALLRETERLRHRLEPVDHTQILELERRGLAGIVGVRTVPRLLCQLLDIDPGEARARHRAAEATGARRSLVGEVLPPPYPVVAAAQAEGVLSARQARVITDCIERLPDAVKHEGPGVEARLVGFARDLHLPPHDLAHAAQREIDWLDPDGKFSDVEYRRRHRTLSLHVRPDGSCSGSFDGTAELGEFLQVTFDSLAAPTPASNGQSDPRTPGQRRHDALLELAKFAVRTGDLPDAGGVTTTVVLTMTEDQFSTGEGFATTAHSAQVPVPEALSWSGGDTRVQAVVLTSVKAVIAYSTTHRIFTQNERLAMAARDGGCAFPGCTAPPGWTQAHHVTEWQDSHRTSIDDGCLLCGYHHREFEQLGWRVIMTTGRPTWIPPRWLDPEQRPVHV